MSAGSISRDTMSHEITDFTTDVLERSNSIPVLVDFWAAWCGPCRTLGPVLERLAEKQAGRWVLAKVDTEKFPQIAAQYGVRGIPNVKLFIKGKVVNEFTGALPERAVEQWLAKAVPGPDQETLEEAARLFQAGEKESAAVLLREVLASDPSNEQARALLAASIVMANPADARSLVRDIEEHSEHYGLVDAVRTVADLLETTPDRLPDDPVRPIYAKAIAALVAQDFDGAIEAFIDVIRQNRMYEEDGSRKAVVAIFRLLGDEHDTTRNHRRAFSSALYA